MSAQKRILIKITGEIFRDEHKQLTKKNLINLITQLKELLPIKFSI